MNSDLAISIRGLSKTYSIAHNQEKHITLAETLLARLKNPLKRPTKETFWALRDVSFDVRRGEVVGIIGRNGAGKSTLLKILSRITQPTAGRVELFGRVGSLLEVGTGFHQELSGRENIYLNGAILGMTKPEIRKQFDAIVDFAGVENFLDTPVKRYSSGMYVRLAFAVAAHLNPEILIVDEVLAVGDAEFQKKCLGKMKDVATGGRTVLFVSHNLGVLRNLCTSACWMDRGQLRQIGDTIAVTDTYLRQNLQQAGREVTLADCKRTGHFGEKLRLDRLDWTGDLPLVHDAPFGVTLHFAAHAAVSDVSVGIGFSSLDGTRLLTYESDLYGPRKDMQAGETASVSVEIDSLPLAPGCYSVDVGARSGDLHGLDYLPGVFQLEVIPNDHTPGNLMAAGAGVRIRSNWSWDHASAAYDGLLSAPVAQTALPGR
jgi:lipopolysaccharide transport system ATP-binding protein